VTRDGDVLWPPPPVQVSAAPAAPAATEVAAPPEKAPMSAARRLGLSLVGIVIFGLIVAFAPQPLPQHFTVLMLSIVIGYYVIGKVAHALHTPLMSVTNAISGVVVVGALLQLATVTGDRTIQLLAAAAVLLASINVFGGFAVTRRMLAMFSKGNRR
jgi:NAD(P) transhydrogenase subunit alpha